MSQRNSRSRRQAVVQSRTKKQGRTVIVFAALALAAMVLAIVLFSPPGYSGFDVIGKEPTIVQVFLPG